MNAARPLPRGACPGALRPMESGDGLLIRVRPHAGRLNTGQLRVLAKLAQRHGNGLIELTRRANIQIRGVTGAALPMLQEELDALGLLDSDPDAEARRNILASPLAGIDPNCADIDPIVQALERWLSSAEPFGLLSPKFAIIVDGGGCLPLHAETADLRFDVLEHDEAIKIRISAGGTAASSAVLGWCGRAEVADVGRRLMQSLAAHCKEGPQPMRAFIAAHGVASLREAIGPYLLEAPAADDLGPCVTENDIGFVQREDGATWFGLGIPFGAGDSAQWEGITVLADQFGNGEIRLTPWRSLLIASISRTDVAGFAAAAEDLGLITQPNDPRRSLVACAGAPHCGAGEVQTRSVALAMADRAKALLDGSVVLHVSGCAKGCARSAPASIVLVGSQGRYRLDFEATPASMRNGETFSEDEALHHLTHLNTRYICEAQPDETAASFLSRITQDFDGRISNAS